MVGLCQPLAPKSSVLGLASPSHTHPAFSPSPLLKPQNTEKALCRDPDTGCVWRGLTKTQTHKQIALCWMMSTQAKDARTECQGHKEGRHCLSHSSLGELNWKRANSSSPGGQERQRGEPI